MSIELEEISNKKRTIYVIFCN